MTATESQTSQLTKSVRIPSQRDWVWRGWQTRYAFLRSAAGQDNLPIILLHGFGAAIGHWRSNQPELAKHHTVYALDLMGFGASEKPATQYRVNLWVEQVFDFWRTFINRPAILVGNSVGSLVSVIAAYTHPEMAAGVVAISLPDVAALEALVPKPVRPIKRSLESLFSSLLVKPIFYVIRRPSVIRYVLENLVYGDRARVDDELVETIAKPARERKAAEALLRLSRGANSPGYSPSLTQAISQLEVPLLLLWGTQDRLIPPAEGRRLVKYSSLAQLIELPGLGHCAHDDDPARVNGEILDWININFALRPL